MNEMYLYRLFDLYGQNKVWNMMYSYKDRKEYIYNLIEQRINDKLVRYSDTIKKEKMLNM